MYGCLEYQLYPVFSITINETIVKLHTQNMITRLVSICSLSDVLSVMLILLSS